MSGKSHVSLLILHVQKYQYVDFLYTDKQIPMITQTTIRSCRVGLTLSSDNLSRNSCIPVVWTVPEVQTVCDAGYLFGDRFSQASVSLRIPCELLVRASEVSIFFASMCSPIKKV